MSKADSCKHHWIIETYPREQGYYHGFSNEALWPLCHIVYTRPLFNKSDWDSYRKVNELFARNGNCALLLASYENRPLGGLMVFSHGSRAYYLYGASSDVERNRMPAYLLQWEAMRWARSKGCRDYDLWGIPDCNAEELEAQFANRADGLWGVYRFKRGFGGEVCRSVGAWDRFYYPLVRTLYRWLGGWRGATPG